MASPRKKPQNRVRRIKVATNCPFCRTDTDPDYKDYKSLKRYMSERAKIVGKDFTGICSKHQRRLSKAIKRARHIGLLPYTPVI